MSESHSTDIFLSQPILGNLFKKETLQSSSLENIRTHPSELGRFERNTQRPNYVKSVFKNISTLNKTIDNRTLISDKISDVKITTNSTKVNSENKWTPQFCKSSEIVHEKLNETELFIDCEKNLQDHLNATGLEDREFKNLIDSNNSQLKPKFSKNYDGEGCIEPNGNESKLSFCRQICCTMVVSSCMAVIGTVIGWTAILPKIQDDERTQFNVTTADVRWLVSSIYLTAIPGNLLGGTVGEVIGPRLCLLILLPLTLVCWICMALTPSLLYLYLPRISMGLMYGLANTLIQPLVTEMCEPRFRGFANVAPEIMASASVLMTYVMANFLSWRVGSALCGGIMIPIFILLCFIPESPYWLMRHGNLEGAEASVKKVLGPKRSHKYNEVLKDIHSSISNQRQTSLGDQLLLLKLPQNWKPLLLVSIMIILREASGKISVFMYTVYIFQEADVPLNPFTCTILVGLTRLISTLFGAILIDRVGRKPLLLSTVITCGCSIIVAGSILLTDQSFIGGKLIPLICILLFCVAYSVGVGPVPWALMGEMLPTPVRGLSTSLVCICFSISMFTITNSFPQMRATLGLGVCFIVFGVFNFIFGIVVWLFMPETKGRTLLELEFIFTGRKDLANNKLLK